MLRRAKRVQSVFDAFCSHYDRADLTLNQEEGRQVEYLLWITQPFFKFTTALSKTKDATIHSVFSIYNKLFDHLEKSIRQLQRKKVPWKQLMLSTLNAAKTKLSEYYSMTDDVPSDLYAIGIIIAPQHKLEFFSTKDWDDPETNWRARYCESLPDYLQLYKQRLLDTQSPLKAGSSAIRALELDMLLEPTASCLPTSSQHNELDQYLKSGEYYPYIELALINAYKGTFSGYSIVLLERPSI
jgi:hypothetical protein